MCVAQFWIVQCFHNIIDKPEYRSMDVVIPNREVFFFLHLSFAIFELFEERVSRDKLNYGLFTEVIEQSIHKLNILVFTLPTCTLQPHCSTPESVSQFICTVVPEVTLLSIPIRAFSFCRHNHSISNCTVVNFFRTRLALCLWKVCTREHT
jgi:hypothetical protein